MVLAHLPIWACEVPDPRAAAIDELHPCEAQKVQSFVSRPAVEATIAKAVELSGSSTARIVRPGQPISMDYQTDRLTIEVDRRNRIIRISCG